LPADHPHIGRATAGLAWIELEAGREQEALAGFETAVAILARSLPPDHALLLATRAGLGRALLAAGRAEEGCAELQAARSLAGGSTRRTEELETALRLCATTG
jgi:hypothetical protein